MDRQNLVVTILACEFAKDFSYFILLHYGTHKKKSDTSAPVASPVFERSSFSFPLQRGATEFAGRIVVTVAIMVSQKESRVFGEGYIDLGEISEELLDLSKGEVKQQVKITKSHEGKEITVGRVVFSLRVSEELIPTFREEDGSMEQALKSFQAKGQSRPQQFRPSADYIGEEFGVSLKGVEESEKMGVLARELSSKQEIVHRLLRQLDDKSESLRITAAEIVDLRKQIKLLQSQNSLLRTQSSGAENAELKQLVLAEVEQFSADQLRKKVVNLSQGYRNEKLKREQLQKTLNSYEKEVLGYQQVRAQNQKLATGIKEAAEKIVRLKRQNEKVLKYKETIQKQEKVICKLEKILDNSFKDSELAKEIVLKQSEGKQEHKKESQELQTAREENQRLRRVIANLQTKLAEQTPTLPAESRKDELEFMLLKAEARNEALEQEMTENSRNYAREMAQLKLRLAEKQAVIDGMSY